MSDFKEYIKRKVMVDGITRGVLSKFPLLGTSMVDVKYIMDNNCKTAYTDGKDVYYNEDFIDSLDYGQRVFVFAHEIMHIAFDHIRRIKGKDDHRLWNIATDSVINQMLLGEGLPIMKGLVNIEEARDKSAEFMYNKLLADRMSQQEKFNEFLDKMQENQESNPNAGEHDNWEDFADNMSKSESESGESSSQTSDGGDIESSGDLGKSGNNSQNSESSDDAGQQVDDSGNDSFEEQFSKMNKEKKKELGKASKKRLQDKKNVVDKNAHGPSGGFTSRFNGVGESDAVVSWKKLLRREIESEEDKWSYRRACEDNDWQARIGTIPSYDSAETEVMLDVSGSVSDAFLKGFLRQLKPILRESKLRVGCFDEFVYGFINIKSIEDIDNFLITRKSTWTENWDAAVRAFSKKREVNKIIFTDGNPCPGVMPKNDLAKINVIWLVFRNKNFNPCCGKVIYIDEKELKLGVDSKDCCEM